MVFIGRLEKSWTEHGITCFYINLPDRHLVSYAHFTDLPGKFQYHDDASVGTDWYADAVAYLKGSKVKKTSWFERRSKAHKLISVQGGSSEFIAECTETLKSWALSVDIPRKFIDSAKLRGKKEINFGGGAYVHFVSLALHRDVEQLKTFIKQMDDAGEDQFVLGSVVKRDIIERAI